MSWLIHSRAGFVTRLVAGLSFFLLLALWDLHKHGRDARRWREYLFLLFCVAVAVAYGVINDQVTSAISWEYFYYGKALQQVLGPQTPPDPMALSVQAAKIGALATWPVGLLLGVAMLIANNPRKNAPPPLAFSRLLAQLPAILAITVIASVIGGVVGYFGRLNWIAQDFRDMWSTDLYRPRRFMCTWGVHLGGYVGGLVATVWAVVRVLRLRRAITSSSRGTS